MLCHRCGTPTQFSSCRARVTLCARRSYLLCGSCHETQARGLSPQERETYRMLSYGVAEHPRALLRE